MSKFAGNRGLVILTSNGTPCVVEVTIVDSKSAFGRTDVLVRGKRGVHLSAWVDSAKLVDTSDQSVIDAIIHPNKDEVAS